MTFATTENTVLAFGLLVMVTALMLAHGIGRRAVHGFAGHGRSVLVLRRTWVFVWILLAIGITTVGFHSGWMGSGSVDAPGDTAPADSSDIAIMTIVQTGIGLQFALPLLFLLLLDRQFRVGLYKYRTAGIGRVGLVGALILTGAGVLLAGLQPLLEGVQFDAYRGGVFPSGAVLSWMLLFIWFLLLALYGAHAFRWIAAASPYRGALTYWADESAGVATGLLARPLRALIFILRILRPSTRHARRLATTVALQYSVLICMMGISWLLVPGLPVGPTGAILYFIYNHAIAFLLFLVCAAAWWMYRTYLRIFHQDRRYLMRSTTPVWLYGSVVLFLLALVPTRIAERQYDRQHIDVLRNVHAMVHAEDYRSLPLDGRFVLSRAMVRLPDGAALRTLYARDEFDFKDFLKALKQRDRLEDLPNRIHVTLGEYERLDSTGMDPQSNNNEQNLSHFYENGPEGNESKNGPITDSPGMSANIDSRAADERGDAVKDSNRVAATDAERISDTESDSNSDSEQVQRTEYAEPESTSQISGLGPAAYSEALDHAVEMDDRHRYMNIQNRQYVIFRGTRDGLEYLIGFSYAAYRNLLARYSLGSAIIGLGALAILYALLIFYWRDYRRNFAGNYRMPYRLPPGRASSSALRKARGSSSRGGA